MHEGCDRASYHEQGEFAKTNDPLKWLVKLGCWGPMVVKCNVPMRCWINGVGGCPNVSGICIGCTMPGFPDRFMPFRTRFRVLWGQGTRVQPMARSSGRCAILC